MPEHLPSLALVCVISHTVLSVKTHRNLHLALIRHYKPSIYLQIALHLLPLLHLSFCSTFLFRTYQSNKRDIHRAHSLVCILLRSNLRRHRRVTMDVRRKKERRSDCEGEEREGRGEGYNMRKTTTVSRCCQKFCIIAQLTHRPHRKVFHARQH